MAATSSDALSVDPEFLSLCGNQTPEELSLLEANLERDGCLDPIILWAGHDDTILDGHTRFRMCTDLGIPFKTKAIKLDTRELALDWIARTQLGRRNASDERKSYLRGKLYIAQKKAEGGRADRNLSGAHNAHPKTSEKLAEQYDVDPATIRRDAEFAEAVDTLAENVGAEVKAEILSGSSPLTKKQAVEIAKLPPKQQVKAVEAARSEEPKPRQDGAALTDVDRLIEGIEKLVAKVETMAAHRMGHTPKSKALVAHLKEAVKLAKAAGRSWRNE